MFKVEKFPHGTFSWADCQSTDAEKAKKFYVELMGWSKNDQPMGEGMVYTMFEKDGENVGALNQMQTEMQAQGIPSFWNNYITVDDVDALAEKVTELGGKVTSPPFDVFESGRMMVIQDPTGANVSLWQAKDSIGASLVNTTGAMIWNELATRDVPKAMEFYKNLLGWEFQKAENLDYHFIVNNGRMNGGMLTINANMGDIPPNWMVYYNIADIDAAVKKVKDLGGQVHVEGQSPVGPFAVIADPAGAVLTIMQADQPQPWLES
ncbi:MAG: VOC family protein [Anaerolineae bacterium]|nr:VOC family protein [Anaerolineae bacterium]